jgi:hypothetical protein
MIMDDNYIPMYYYLPCFLLFRFSFLINLGYPFHEDFPWLVQGLCELQA